MNNLATHCLVVALLLAILSCWEVGTSDTNEATDTPTDQVATTADTTDSTATEPDQKDADATDPMECTVPTHNRIDGADPRGIHYPSSGRGRAFGPGTERGPRGGSPQGKNLRGTCP